MKTLSQFILLFFICVQLSFAQNNNINQKKLSNFELQSSELIDDDGQVISTSDYNSNVYWFPVKVPTTVLSGLVANKVYPDPYSGMNNMLIPDASDKFNEKYDLEKFSHIPNVDNPWKKPYWYRTSFVVPASDKGRHFQLIFKGINYRASVWMNGQQIADSSQMVGMFAEYSFDVSDKVIVGEENILAVKIYPLDYPGFPAEEQLEAMGDFYPNGGPTGDIGKNVTMMCSVGWDWVPPARDRNIGIWQPVYLRTSGKVTISRPRIITELPNLPDTSVASISLDLSLVNHSNINSKGTLNIDLIPENFPGKTIHFSRNISIEAGSDSQITLNAENTKELLIDQPHLWWPNGAGKANLYRLRLQYKINGVVSDETSTIFGIRTVSSKAVDVPNKLLRRDFYVNGKRIQLVGGAWVPDMLLNRDSVRYDAELHLCKNANINLVRIWGGGITPPDVFWELTDRYGLLVWSDFWVTGDTHGEFKGSTDWPLQPNVFISNVRNTILRIRNHPSLLVWTGGNEGHIGLDVYNEMRESIINLDGTRPFIPSSSGFAKIPDGMKASWPDNLASGVYSSGPYTWQDSKEYYRLATEAKDWVFKDETGLPSHPPYNTLKKIIPNLVWDSTLPFPLNHTWGYHDACTGNGRYDKYYEEMVERYGEASSIKDYSEKMQLMNATGYQGIFEAAGHKLNEIGGVMLWKLNAAFPSVMWQVFDWYLETNAGYYFMKNACEPIHVQLNALNHDVTVLNRTYKPVTNLTVEADIFNLNSRLLSHKTAIVNLSASDVQKPFSIRNVLKNAKGVNFIILNLKDANGKLVSHNTYWISADDDYTALNNMELTTVDTYVLNKIQQGTETIWKLKFSNNSDKLAFFIRPRLLNNGEDVLPSYWSDNYFSLAPGESINVSVSVSSNQLNGNNQEILIEGWNLNDIKIPLKK